MGPITLAAGVLLVRRARERVEDSHAMGALRAPRFTLAPVSILGALKFLLIAGGVLAVAFWIARWDAGRERDAWWRGEIAAKSSAVRGVLNRADPEIAASDETIIQALGDSDARLEEAERQLRQPPAADPGPDCPRIKRQCLR